MQVPIIVFWAILGGVTAIILFKAPAPTPLSGLMFFAGFVSTLFFPKTIWGSIMDVFHTDFVQGWINKRIAESKEAMTGGISAWGVANVAIFTVMVGGAVLVASKLLKAVAGMIAGLVIRWAMVTQFGIDPSSLLGEVI